MTLTGKVLVVTGAGSGIGRAVALEAVRRGGIVAAVDLNATTLEETAILAAADGAVSTHVLNITDRAAVEARQNEGPPRTVTSAGAVQRNCRQTASLNDSGLQLGGSFDGAVKGCLF